MEFQLSYFKILKDDAVKVLHSICQQIWKTEPWPQDWKRSVFTPIPKKSNTKECLNYHTIVLISHANEVLLQILLAAKSLQSCPTLCDPIDSSPPGSAIPGILQARTLEWVAISFSTAVVKFKDWFILKCYLLTFQWYWYHPFLHQHRLLLWFARIFSETFDCQPSQVAQW